VARGCSGSAVTQLSNNSSARKQRVGAGFAADPLFSKPVEPTTLTTAFWSRQLLGAGQSYLRDARPAMSATNSNERVRSAGSNVVVVIISSSASVSSSSAVS
jgi:hypothetical protein